MASEKETGRGQIRAEKTPTQNPSALRFESAEFISDPISGTEFFLYLKGENFNPETVRLKITGPGCGGDQPCTVPNGALRLYGKITETVIEKAPVTLAQGEYRLWLENNPGNTSNQLNILVPGSTK